MALGEWKVSITREAIASLAALGVTVMVLLCYGKIYHHSLYIFILLRILVICRL